jgi:hypothetical protein
MTPLETWKPHLSLPRATGDIAGLPSIVHLTHEAHGLVHLSGVRLKEVPPLKQSDMLYCTVVPELLQWLFFCCGASYWALIEDVLKNASNGKSREH